MPSSTKLTESSFVSFVCLMKWRYHWEKISFCIHPEGGNKWIDPGSVPFISSCFISFFGNTSNGGMKFPLGLIQVMTVARDLHSVDWREDMWCLPFSPNIFMFCAVKQWCRFHLNCKVLQDYVEWCPLWVRRFKKTELLVQVWNPLLLRVIDLQDF